MAEHGRTHARPVIRLYTQTVNPFSEKVAAALALKRLPFERVISDDPDDVARWSPIARTLPVLEVDGRRRAESMAIVAWIDELAPEPPLYSSDPRTAVAQKSLAQWADDSFLWYWNRWRTARYPRPGDEEPADDSLLGRLRRHVGERVARSVARPFGRGPESRAEQRELEVIGEIEDRLSDLVGFLGTRPFFHADAPSIADLSIYSFLVVLRGGAIPGCAEAIEERPTLVAFVERMAARIATSEAGLAEEETG
ncbi:MAG: glutathione S-transferase family protein [Myxococcota bacterium]